MYRPTTESSTSSQPYQPYSLINPTNLDMNFEDLMFSQEYNYSEDYSMGHGSGHGSAHGSAHGSVPFHDDEDDSPVEEVSPVKPKKPSRRATKVKEPPKEWTVKEEIALCQGWCDVSENNISGNSMEAKRFWEAVIRTQNDLQGFNLEYCYNIFKDHPGWTDVEMPHFFKIRTRKKFKTSETTSRSASGGINLNEEADEAVQETQEFRPMGRDRAKTKKKAAGSSSSIVDLVADKFYNMKKKTRNNRLIWR
ncbi:40S ribosomal protein S20-2 [Tanacetum coccineum]